MVDVEDINGGIRLGIGNVRMSNVCGDCLCLHVSDKRLHLQVVLELDELKLNHQDTNSTSKESSINI